MRFILGILIGIGVGATIGLIMAPQSGRQTREELEQRIRRTANDSSNSLPTN